LRSGPLYLIGAAGSGCLAATGGFALTGRIVALNAAGWFHIQLGAPGEGLRLCQQALDMQREIEDRLGQGETLDSIARAYTSLARYDEATAYYRQALQLYRESGDRYNEANYRFTDNT